MLAVSICIVVRPAGAPECSKETLWPLPACQKPSPVVKDVRAGQGLQPAIPLTYGLAAQAAVELCLLHTLVEAHDMGTQLPLQPLAAVDALAQAVQLELAQLEPAGQQCRHRRQGQASVGEQLPCFPPCSAQRLPRGATGQTIHSGSSPGCVPVLLRDLKKTSCLSGPWFPRGQNKVSEVSGPLPKLAGNPRLLKYFTDQTCSMNFPAFLSLLIKYTQQLISISGQPEIPG